MTYMGWYSALGGREAGIVIKTKKHQKKNGNEHFRIWFSSSVNSDLVRVSSVNLVNSQQLGSRSGHELLREGLLRLDELLGNNNNNKTQ